MSKADALSDGGPSIRTIRSKDGGNSCRTFSVGTVASWNSTLAGAPSDPCRAGDLDRILLNLVLNAFDAMPEGGVLTMETTIDDVRTASEADPSAPYARLTVTDTGCGMAPGGEGPYLRCLSSRRSKAARG